MLVREGWDDPVGDRTRLSARELTDRPRVVPGGVVRILHRCGLVTQLVQQRDRSPKHAPITDRQPEQVATSVDLSAIDTIERFQTRQHGREARASAEARRGASRETS